MRQWRGEKIPGTPELAQPRRGSCPINKLGFELGVGSRATASYSPGQSRLDPEATPWLDLLMLPPAANHSAPAGLSGPAWSLDELKDESELLELFLGRNDDAYPEDDTNEPKLDVLPCRGVVAAAAEEWDCWTIDPPTVVPGIGANGLVKLGCLVIACDERPLPLRCWALIANCCRALALSNEERVLSEPPAPIVVPDETEPDLLIPR